MIESVLTDRLTEASFATSKIYAILVKVCSVLSKATGEHLALSPIPLAFESPEGKFHGFDAMLGAGPGKIRFNVRYGGQAEIASVSVWKSHGKPSLEIDLQGFSITAVVDQIASILKGDVKDYMGESRIAEASSAEIVASFLRDTPNAPNDIKTHGIKALYPTFQRWGTHHHQTTVAFNTFRVQVSAYFKTANPAVAREIPVVGVHAAPSEEYIEDRPDEAELFMREIAANDAAHKYELLETTVKAIADPRSGINGAFIYGTGGTGKTKNIQDMLKETGSWERVSYLKGGIAGFSGLLSVLFKNRRNKILVLDDNDDILKEGKAMNYLKAALDLDNPRRITYSKADAAGPRQRGAGRRGGGEASEESVKREAIDLNALGIDFGSDAGIGTAEMMNDFIFQSKMIFISNLTKVPQPILDRTMVCSMNFTKEQILDLIKERLAVLFNDVEGITIEDKEKVYQFMVTFKAHIKSATFRLYKRLLVIYSMVGKNETKFKSQAALMLRSEI